MKMIAAFLVLALSGIALPARAEMMFAARAFVVAVDVGTKTVRLKHAVEGVWKETVATWDEKTEWERAGEKIWESKPATADLVKELRKDTKVYVKISDRGTKGKSWLEGLKTIPPDSEVK